MKDAFVTTCLEVSPLRDPDLFRRWLERMPEPRRQKVNAMRFEEGRCLSLGAGILLDRALAKRGVDGRTVRLAEEEYGRPWLPDYPEFHFSLSHAGSWAVCAVGPAPVGCDVERLGRGDERLVRRFFHPGEREALAREKDPEAWDRLFTRIWTRKESYLKAVGRGLSLPLDSFQTLREEPGVWYDEHEMAEGYAFCCCGLGERPEAVRWERVLPDVPES
ncbi:MAG: 4'-phosphopantetheinyl transferase superfamily protein [Clostridia bacterium]|nr:4'-phosphopantetheinyl transferase superfamily protein [Clostridia bacterium]